MFKSKQRDVITPQREHALFTGSLAYLWGNDDFQRPKVPFDSFVKGIALHDRGYGANDNDPIGGVSRERWLELQQQGVNLRCDDPITDAIVLTHIRRLVSWNSDLEGAADLMAQADERIAQRLSETEFTQNDLAWMDAITNLCDSIAFDFAFEEPKEGKRSVYPALDSDEVIEVTYRIEEKGVIRVDPWVFSVPDYQGFVMGYQAESYPERLEPELISFHILS